MKFDLHNPALNLNGDALKSPVAGAVPNPQTGQYAPEDLEPRKLVDLVNDALLAPSDKLTGADMAKRYALATRIHGATEPVELSSDELKLVLDVVEKAIKAPLLYGQIAAVLEIKQ